jgi:DNA-dependent RNA polymerase auxiliary subunit epsilon
LDIFRIYCDGKKPAALLIPDRVEVTYGKYEVKTEEEIELRKKVLRDKFNIENIEVVSDVEKIIDKIIC